MESRTAATFCRHRICHHPHLAALADFSQRLPIRERSLLPRRGSPAGSSSLLAAHRAANLPDAHPLPSPSPNQPPSPPQLLNLLLALASRSPVSNRHPGHHRSISSSNSTDHNPNPKKCLDRRADATASVPASPSRMTMLPPQPPPSAEAPTAARHMAASSSSNSSSSRYAPGPTARATQQCRAIGRRAWLLAAGPWLASSAFFARASEPLLSSGGGGGGGPWGLGTAHAAAAAATTTPGRAGALTNLQAEASLAYAERRFQDAVNLLTECISEEPAESRWREMRAEALVDGKNFSAALGDFEAALGLVPESDLVTRARLLTGRALAYEGLSEWGVALKDYLGGMDLAAKAGEPLDPYVLNSIGNCLNSLGRWEDARQQYLASADVFQQARGFRGRNGSTTPRLDGAVFASSNAALMLAQLGDTDGAVKEMVRIARRAPGSADMRAALAALYWGQGRQREAEEMWEFACDRVTVGCTKYTDLDWLGRVRRWPPVMVNAMADFLAMR